MNRPLAILFALALGSFAGCLTPPTMPHYSLPSWSVESFAVNPANGNVVFSAFDGSGHGQVHELNLSTRAERVIMDWPGRELRLPRFDVTGELMAVVATTILDHGARDEIFLVTVATGELKSLGVFGRWIDRLDVSPSGHAVAFVAGDEHWNTSPWAGSSNNADVWAVLASAPGEFRRLTDWRASWVPDVAFINEEQILTSPYIGPQYRAPLGGLWLVSLNGGLQQLDVPPDDDWDPAYGTQGDTCRSFDGRIVLRESWAISVLNLTSLAWEHHGLGYDAPQDGFRACLVGPGSTFVFDGHAFYGDDPSVLYAYNGSVHQLWPAVMIGTAEAPL